MLEVHGNDSITMGVVLGLYGRWFGMWSLGLCWGSVGTMEKKMETSTMDYVGLKFLGGGFWIGFLRFGFRVWGVQEGFGVRVGGLGSG